MGLSEQWVARKETVSETAPPAERVEVCQSDRLCGELLPDATPVGADGDPASSPNWNLAEAGVSAKFWK